MTKLKNKISNALMEGRMLVIGSQVLLGFQFRSIFENSFEKLPLSSQALKLSALGLLCIAIGLLIAPAAYHRIVERGEDSHELHRFATRMMDWALLPFAIGLGIDLYVAFERVLGFKLALVAGVLGFIAALFFWYMLEFYTKRTHAGHTQFMARGESTMNSETATDGRDQQPGQRNSQPDAGAAAQTDERKGEGGEGGEGDGETKLTDKINHVLTEARVVLPGAQALLGFQFIAVLTESFEKLPDTVKYVHLASLGFIALTIVLLMTPAAYHRIVERGEETEHFHRFASKFVVAALVPLALGLASDVYVVIIKVTDSQVVSVVGALVVLAIFWELWFGLTLYRRTQKQYAD
jgi:DMSO reductase anchor subunit